MLKGKKKQFSYIHKKKTNTRIWYNFPDSAVQLKIHLMTELFPFFSLQIRKIYPKKKSIISKLRIYFWGIFYTNNLHTGNQVTICKKSCFFFFLFFGGGGWGTSSMCQAKDYSWCLLGLCIILTKQLLCQLGKIISLFW